MKSLTLLIGVVLALVGCSSPTKSTTPDYAKDEVLSTLNDKPQPEWADESTPFKIERGTVYSVGVAYIRGDERPDAGARVSEHAARAQIAKAVETRLSSLFQSGEENFSYDSQVAKYIGGEVSNITSSSMRNAGHWWVRYATSEEDGSRRIRIKLYTLVTMPESDFKIALQKAATKGIAERKVSPSFQKQLDSHWEKFIEGEGRNPAQAN